MAKSLFGTLYCPRCKSKDISVTDTGRSFSITKGVIGGVLVGPVGGLLGVNGKKNKSICHCNKCGKVWKELI